MAEGGTIQERTWVTEASAVSAAVVAILSGCGVVIPPEVVGGVMALLIVFVRVASKKGLL